METNEERIQAGRIATARRLDKTGGILAEIPTCWPKICQELMIQRTRYARRTVEDKKAEETRKQTPSAPEFTGLCSMQRKFMVGGPSRRGNHGLATGMRHRVRWHKDWRRRPRHGRSVTEHGVAEGLRSHRGEGFQPRCLRPRSTDLIAKDAQAGQHMARLVVGQRRQRLGRGMLRLGRSEHVLVGLQLDLEGLAALLEHLVLLLHGLHLLLGQLVLLLQVGHQLLELHATQLRLELLGQLSGHLVLLADEMDDDQQHEVDEVDGSLHDVLLGFGQALRWVPSGALKEPAVDSAVQLPVQVAQVLSPVALRNAMLLPLVIGLARDHAALALATAQLLQWGLPADFFRRDQTHQVGRGEFLRPFKGLRWLLRFRPRAVGRVGGRWRSHNVFGRRPGRGFDHERVLRALRTMGQCGRVERVEGSARQGIHAWEGR